MNTVEEFTNRANNALSPKLTNWLALENEIRNVFDNRDLSSNEIENIKNYIQT